jgi:hypothetical protein
VPASPSSSRPTATPTSPIPTTRRWRSWALLPLAGETPCGRRLAASPFRSGKASRWLLGRRLRDRRQCRRHGHGYHGAARGWYGGRFTCLQAAAGDFLERMLSWQRRLGLCAGNAGKRQQHGSSLAGIAAPWVETLPMRMAALLAWQQPAAPLPPTLAMGRFDDFFTTLQALPALTLRPYPLTGDRAICGS